MAAQAALIATGRHYADVIEDCNRDGQMRNQVAFRDHRATRFPEVRRRITATAGRAPAPIHHRSGSGRRYDDLLLAPRSGEWLPRDQFINRAVRLSLRHNDGFNIHPRREVRRGYRLDGFVVDDDDEDEESCSDSQDSSSESVVCITPKKRYLKRSPPPAPRKRPAIVVPDDSCI